MAKHRKKVPNVPRNVYQKIYSRGYDAGRKRGQRDPKPNTEALEIQRRMEELKEKLATKRDELRDLETELIELKDMASGAADELDEAHGGLERAIEEISTQV